jgi:hypothetical protein
MINFMLALTKDIAWTLRCGKSRTQTTFSSVVVEAFEATYCSIY